MILPQSARKLADSSLGEGAQRVCFDGGFTFPNSLTAPSEREHKGNALTEALSSLVEGGAELARRREFIYTIMR